MNTIAIMKIDDSNRELAVQLAMSMDLDELCKYCGGIFDTHEKLHNCVYAGYHKYGRIAHKECWDANNEN